MWKCIYSPLKNDLLTSKILGWKTISQQSIHCQLRTANCFFLSFALSPRHFHSSTKAPGRGWTWSCNSRLPKVEVVEPQPVARSLLPCPGLFWHPGLQLEPSNLQLLLPHKCSNLWLPGHAEWFIGAMALTTGLEGPSIFHKFADGAMHAFNASLGKVASSPSASAPNLQHGHPQPSHGFWLGSVFRHSLMLISDFCDISSFVYFSFGLWDLILVALEVCYLFVLSDLCTENPALFHSYIWSYLWHFRPLWNLEDPRHSFRPIRFQYSFFFFK